MRSGSVECISIRIINDTVHEPTEVFLVILSNSGAVRLENRTARVEIIDDDGEKAHAMCYTLNLRGDSSGVMGRYILQSKRKKTIP